MDLKGLVLVLVLSLIVALQAILLVGPLVNRLFECFLENPGWFGSACRIFAAWVATVLSFLLLIGEAMIVEWWIRYWRQHRKGSMR